MSYVDPSIAMQTAGQGGKEQIRDAVLPQFALPPENGQYSGIKPCRAGCRQGFKAFESISIATAGLWGKALAGAGGIDRQAQGNRGPNDSAASKIWVNSCEKHRDCGTLQLFSAGLQWWVWRDFRHVNSGSAADRSSSGRSGGAGRAKCRPDRGDNGGAQIDALGSVLEFR